METRDHQSLKRLAVAFLFSRGCRAVAVEARCPFSRFVLDAAGYMDSRPAPALAGAAPPPPADANEPSGGAAPSPQPVPSTGPSPAWSLRPVKCEPRTIIVECKQSRADLLRDSRERDALRDEMARLTDEIDRLRETRIKPREPHLRRVERDLFGAEREAWDFARSRCAPYHAAVDALARCARRVREQTKFDEIARRALADRLYILAPAGLLPRRDVPPGWGLVEVRRSRLPAAGADPAAAVAEHLAIRVEAPELPCDEKRRARMLRNIAFAATREWTRRDEALRGCAIDAMSEEASTPGVEEPGRR